MAESRDDAKGATESLLGLVTRRDALKSVAAAAGFVTLGLKQALADSRMTGKPLFGSDCGRLNQLVPATPGPEYSRLLQEGIADPKGFLTRRFSFTKTQLAALNAATPAEIAALQGGLRAAQQKNLKLVFTCGRAAAPAGGQVQFSSARLHVSEVLAPASAGQAKIAAGSPAQAGAPAQAMATAQGAPGFQGMLNISSPQVN